MSRDPRDGVVGIPFLHGDDIAFEAAVVQIDETARRVPTSSAECYATISGDDGSSHAARG